MYVFWLVCDHGASYRYRTRQFLEGSIATWPLSWYFVVLRWFSEISPGYIAEHLPYYLYLVGQSAGPICRAVDLCGVECLYSISTSYLWSNSALPSCYPVLRKAAPPSLHGEAWRHSRDWQLGSGYGRRKVFSKAGLRRLFLSQMEVASGKRRENCHKKTLQGP